MKHLLIFISFLLLQPAPVFSQDHNIHPVSYIFDPGAGAQQDINNALRQAALQHKQVFIIFGGDWSGWCRLLFTSFFQWTDAKQYMDAHSIIVKVNFSPLNKNEAVLERYGCPRDQGYPIVMVLNEKGEKLHAQNLDEFKICSPRYTNYSDQALLAAMKKWAGN